MGDKTGAFFDVDKTLVGRNILHYYNFFVRNTGSTLGRAARFAKLYGPQEFWRVIWLELRGHRETLNEVVYAHYHGMNAGEVKGLAHQCYEEVIKPNHFPEGYAKVREHLDKGDEVVFVTGSLDFIIRPMMRDLGVEHLIAPSLREAGGYFTGLLEDPPGAVGGQKKANLMRLFAGDRGIDLGMSFAYADSIADLPMLKAVENPAVVNPDKKLLAVAYDERAQDLERLRKNSNLRGKEPESHAWPIYRWGKERAA